jgi:hypothetical protein
MADPPMQGDVILDPALIAVPGAETFRHPLLGELLLSASIPVQHHQPLAGPRPLVISDNSPNFRLPPAKIPFHVRRASLRTTRILGFCALNSTSFQKAQLAVWMVSRETREERSRDPPCGISIFAASCRIRRTPVVSLDGPHKRRLRGLTLR